MKTVLDREDLVFGTPELGCVLCLPGLPGGGSGIYDRSPYANSGTITGATWKRLPSGLWCLDFDGQDDSISLGTPENLDITGDITICAWVYPASLPSESGNNFAILSKTQTLITNGYEFWLRTSDKIDFFTNQAATYQSSGSDDSVVTKGEWQHLAVTRRGTTANLYKNAVDVTNTQGTHLAPTPAGQTACVGRMGDSYPFHGCIALVLVYNRALSALELQNLFNRGKRLFGVWKL